MSARSVRPVTERPITGRHVLFVILGFFATVIGVNGAFAYFAINSFPGEDVKQSYTQGLEYNQTLAQHAAQAALGWRASADIFVEGPHRVVRMHFVDRAGRPIDGLAVTGELRRPADSREDIDLSFAPRGGGVYEARVDAVHIGLWELRGEARRGQDRFTFTRRETWRPPSP